MPILPPTQFFKLFFFKIWANNLQVVDLPLVPVTTILLNLLLVKKNKSISVIIFFLYLIKVLFFSKVMPGERTI